MADLICGQVNDSGLAISKCPAPGIRIRRTSSPAPCCGLDVRIDKRGRLRKSELQLLRSHSTWIRHIVERQRHVNGEDAACTRYIPNVDVAFVCPDRLARNGQPETQPRAILPSPLTERLKRVTQGGRDTPALVFHLDQE